MKILEKEPITRLGRNINRSVIKFIGFVFGCSFFGYSMMVIVVVSVPIGLIMLYISLWILSLCW